MNNKVTNIYIAENIPSMNKGEMTILGGMLESFKVLGDVRVSMISNIPEVDKSRCEPSIRIIDVKKYLPLLKVFKYNNFLIKCIDSIPILYMHLIFLICYKFLGNTTKKIFKSELWNTILESDVIVIGHNGTFGLGNSLGNPIAFYPIFIPGFCKLLHKPIVLYGGSLPELKTVPFPINRIFSSALNKASFISLREEQSFQYLEDAKYKGNNAIVTADPACLLRPESKDQTRKIMKEEGIEKTSNPLFGFTITRNIADNTFPDLAGKESYNRHTADLAKVIDSLIDNLNINVIFLPHCIGVSPNLDDRIVSNQVISQCRNKNKIKMISKEYSAAELKGLIGECDLFIGERLHSVINALTMHVPSVLITTSTDPRLGIIKMIGQGKAIFILDNQRDDVILAKIIDIWNKRKEIHDELIAQVTTIQKKAIKNGELLKQLLDLKTDH